MISTALDQPTRWDIGAGTRQTWTYEATDGIGQVRQLPVRLCGEQAAQLEPASVLA